MKKQKPLAQFTFYLAVALFVGISLFPFLWQISTSLKGPEQIFKMPPEWIPSRFYFENYKAVFAGRPFHRNLLNSFVTAGSTTAFSVFVASFCAYALARLKFRFKGLILSLVLSVSMFPAIAIISPLFLFMKEMHLINTYMALILPYTTFSMPLSIWNLTSFFREIPFELEEAAKVDGCTPFQAFRQVIIPLAAPGLFTTAILVFISAWNEFLFALTFTTNDAARTVPVAIAMFPGLHEIPWAEIAAASVVVTLPLVALVLLFQRRIIAGLTSGAVKG